MTLLTAACEHSAVRAAWQVVEVIHHAVAVYEGVFAAATDGRRPVDHLTGGVDTPGQTVLTAERAEVISGGIDGDYWQLCGRRGRGRYRMSECR